MALNHHVSWDRFRLFYFFRFTSLNCYSYRISPSALNTMLLYARGAAASVCNMYSFCYDKFLDRTHSIFLVYIQSDPSLLTQGGRGHWAVYYSIPQG